MIKIKQGFEIRTICGENLIVPLGKHNIDFSKVIYLNETSMFIWRLIEKGVNGVDEIVEAMTEVYNVERETCLNDVNEFLDSLIENNIIEKNNHVQN